MDTGTAKICKREACTNPTKQPRYDYCSRDCYRAALRTLSADERRRRQIASVTARRANIEDALARQTKVEVRRQAWQQGYQSGRHRENPVRFLKELVQRLQDFLTAAASASPPA